VTLTWSLLTLDGDNAAVNGPLKLSNFCLRRQRDLSVQPKAKGSIRLARRITAPAAQLERDLRNYSRNRQLKL